VQTVGILVGLRGRRPRVPSEVRGPQRYAALDELDALDVNTLVGPRAREVVGVNREVDGLHRVVLTRDPNAIKSRAVPREGGVVGPVDQERGFTAENRDQRVPLERNARQPGEVAGGWLAHQELALLQVEHRESTPVRR